MEYGRKAIVADDGNAEAHKWFAIALGSAGEYLGVSEKIQNGFVFKEHIDIATKINPSDPLLHYLLGRFCYEVSTFIMKHRIKSSLNLTRYHCCLGLNGKLPPHSSQ